LNDDVMNEQGAELWGNNNYGMEEQQQKARRGFDGGGVYYSSRSRGPLRKQSRIESNP